MKIVVHILFKDSEIDDLFKNKDLFNYEVKHILLTNYTQLNKNIFIGFEQIFFYNYENDLVNNVKCIVKFIKNLNYKEIFISNSNKNLNQTDIKFEDIDVKLNQLAVIDDIINV